MIFDACEEFRADWIAAGKATTTVDTYCSLLVRFCAEVSDVSLISARMWVSSAPSVSMRRKRAQALRDFGKWSEEIGDNDVPWWPQIRTPVERERPQRTATPDDFTAALTRLSEARDRAILAVLWGGGLRRGEVANLTLRDVNLSDGYLIVRSSKTGKPRVVPIPPMCARLIRRHLRSWTADSLFGLGTSGIRLMLRRHGLLPAHAWRRGWAVEALRAGVSEASVRAAAGWSSGAMVVRYTRALSTSLAIDEFNRVWTVTSR